tara:strand:+ start:966 stop:1574 length:609 start_codon:yes stop_codon:yes gene_type:complete
LVFDLGANIGRDTKILSELGAKVVAVEPVPNLAKHLKKKFEGDRRVIIIAKGVAAKKSIMKLNLCENSEQHSTFVEVRKTPLIFSDKFTNALDVETTPLEEIIKQYGIPNLIKIDVEGFEYEVLKTLKTHPKHIIFEVTFSILEIAKKCIDKLESLGYKKFNFLKEVSHSFYFKKMLSSEQLKKELDGFKEEVVFGDIYAEY